MSVGTTMTTASVPTVSQVGPGPASLVRDMHSSPLKAELETCLDAEVLMQPHPFSIGHRGACEQFPEHTRESYQAAIDMGAGIVECDVAVTKDGELVCRHSECDLHHHHPRDRSRLEVLDPVRCRQRRWLHHGQC